MVREIIQTLNDDTGFDASLERGRIKLLKITKGVKGRWGYNRKKEEAIIPSCKKG
jgi:hypothetical protein